MALNLIHTHFIVLYNMIQYIHIYLHTKIFFYLNLFVQWCIVNEEHIDMVQTIVLGVNAH